MALAGLCRFTIFNNFQSRRDFIFVSSLAISLRERERERERERDLVALLYMGWSVVCDCGISCSKSFEPEHEISYNVAFHKFRLRRACAATF